MLSQYGILIFKNIFWHSNLYKMCLKTWHGMSYEDRLSHLCLTSLENRRKLCYLFKLLKDLTYYPNFPIHTITTPHDTHSHSLTFFVPMARTNSSQGSFFCQTPHQWNNLPQAVVSVVSITNFKYLLRKHFTPLVTTVYIILLSLLGVHQY